MHSCYTLTGELSYKCLQTLTGILEARLIDGSEEFVFEEEVFETGGVGSDIAATKEGVEFELVM